MIGELGKFDWEGVVNKGYFYFVIKWMIVVVFLRLMLLEYVINVDDFFIEEKCCWFIWVEMLGIFIEWINVVWIYLW